MITSTVLISQNSALAVSNIKNVYQTPIAPNANEKVTVYLEVYNNSEIKNVILSCCTLAPSPKQFCTQPKQMECIGNNLYNGEIDGYDVGYKLGYNITINYANGSKENATDFGGNNIEETTAGHYYFAYEITSKDSGNEKSNDTKESKFTLGFELILLICLICIILVAIIIFKLARKKDKKIT